MRETDPPDFSWASPILNFGWWWWWFDAIGGCDQVSWRGKRSESDQNDRWDYVHFNHYHLAIYQSALLVFGHRSPVYWPSTHPIPTWGRFQKRIHRKVFCRPMFSCPPKPYFDPLTCFRCQLNLCMRRQQIQVVQLWRALTKQSPGGRQGHDNYIQSGRCGN